jgi:hypothetical protein
MDDPQFNDAPSRRTVLAAGGAAALAAMASAAPADAAGYEGVQLGWRFCPNCRGLFFSPKNKPAGTCPAGGKHQPRKDVNYVLYEQGGTWFYWVRCTKCAGLFAGEEEDTVCPKGGQHTGDNARLYKLWRGPGITGVTDDAWDGCQKCSGLFNWAGGNVGSCPADGGHQREGGVAMLVTLY